MLKAYRNRTDPELRHLRYLVALGEELHFGRAAEKVGIAQPPFSQQIQSLEGIVGEQLVERRPAVRLTPAGERLFELGRRTIAEIRRGVAEAREAGRGAQGTLRIGFAASVLSTFMPRAIRKFRVAYPGVDLKLRALSTAEQIDALRNDEIDVAFLREASAPPDIVSEVVLTEAFAAVVPSDHPLKGRSDIPVSLLADEPFVLFPRSVAPRLYDQVIALLHDAGVQPEVILEAQEWMIIVGLVEAGAGVSIVPASFQRLRWRDVVYLPLADSTRSTSVSFARVAGRTNAAADNFHRILKQASV